MKRTDPFYISTHQLIKKLQASKKDKDPKVWLYKNDLRTEAFMLESLFRLYEKGLDHPDFRSGHKLIKKLEDALGQIDFYDVFYKEFKKNKKINKETESYILRKKEKAFAKLEKVLHKRGGLEGRIGQQYAFVKSQRIKFNASEIKKIEAAIEREIKDILEFVKTSKCDFKYLEEEVHELRRKLRWISMYGHSLGGIIKLQDPGKKEKWEKKYLSKKITGLAFNKLPVKKFPSHILFDKNKFYALSWLINELGDLKDKGLRLELLSKVISKTQEVDHKEAIKKAQQEVNSKINETDVLKQASVICNAFFNKDKILEDFIIKKRS
jgi:hypothetical protein